jgi:hypothetical protein
MVRREWLTQSPPRTQKREKREKREKRRERASNNNVIDTTEHAC